ncbi:MAG: phage major capsid protein, partial [Sulfuritalea sp.]|nr:phage major capsid protein [Sulfuritalea sp.]
MNENAEVLDLIQKQGTAIDGFVKRYDARFAALEGDLRDFEKKSGRPFLSGSESSSSSENVEHKKAFDNYLRRGDAAGLGDLQAKAMSSGVDADGGFLVLPEIDRIIDRIAPTVSPMYRLASIVNAGSAKWEKLVKTAGMAMRRVADGSTGGETTEPKYSKVSVDIFTAEVEPWVNNETLEDAFVDLTADLAEEAAIGFAEGAGAEFITGNGVGTARGILTYDTVANASFEWGKVGYIPSGKSAAFASVAPADKIVNLVTALKPRYRQNATFIMNDTTLGIVRQMKDGTGSYYLWQADPT